MSESSSSIGKTDSKDSHPVFTFPENISTEPWIQILDKFEPHIVLAILPLVCKYFYNICLNTTTCDLIPKKRVQEATGQTKNKVGVLSSYLCVRRNVRNFPFGVRVPDSICIDVFTRGGHLEFNPGQLYAMTIRPIPCKDLSPQLSNLLEDKTSNEYLSFEFQLEMYRKVVRYLDGKGPKLSSYELDQIFSDPDYIKLTPYILEFESRPTTNSKPLIVCANQFLNSLTSIGLPIALKALMVRDMQVNNELMDSIDYIKLDTFYARNVNVLAPGYITEAPKNKKTLLTFPNAEKLHISIHQTSDSSMALARKTEELVFCFPIRSEKSFSTRVYASHCASLKRM